MHQRSGSLLSTRNQLTLHRCPVHICTRWRPTCAGNLFTLVLIWGLRSWAAVPFTCSNQWFNFAVGSNRKMVSKPLLQCPIGPPSHLLMTSHCTDQLVPIGRSKCSTCGSKTRSVPTSMSHYWKTIRLKASPWCRTQEVETLGSACSWWPSLEFTLIQFTRAILPSDLKVCHMLTRSFWHKFEMYSLGI